MPALVIGATQLRQIADLCKLAAVSVLNPQTSEAIAQRDMRAYRDMMSMYTLELPVGFFVTYSHEMQPAAGLCHHLSVSVARHGKMAGVEAVEIILEAFDMAPLQQSDRIWIEDIGGGEKALNILQQVAVAP